MKAADAIAMLDRQLAAHGAAVTVFRGATSVPTKAMVRGLRAEELRSGSSSAQAVSRAIFSPTDFPNGFLPIRKTDKALWNGVQRDILAATPILFGADVVRIEVDFQG